MRLGPLYNREIPYPKLGLVSYCTNLRFLHNAVTFRWWVRPCKFTPDADLSSRSASGCFAFKVDQRGPPGLPAGGFGCGCRGCAMIPVRVAGWTREVVAALLRKHDAANPLTKSLPSASDSQGRAGLAYRDSVFCFRLYITVCLPDSSSKALVIHAKDKPRTGSRLP